MIEPEILETAAYWEATFRQPLAPSEKALYVMHLTSVEKRDAFAAIDDCARRAEFPPSPQRIAEVAVDCRYERLQLDAGSRPLELEQGDGPFFGEYLDENPHDRERLIALMQRAVPPRDPPLTAEDRERLGQTKPPTRPPVPMNLCSGVGKVGVVKDGVLVCPECGDPVAEGCGSSRYRGEAS